MPIKPENKNRYPKNWKEIRGRILLRANNKCEFCSVENHSVGYRNEFGLWCEIEKSFAGDMHAELAEQMGHKIIKIVLTIAYMDHEPENNSDSNLRALCQKCHLNYDKAYRAKSRRDTLNKKRRQQNLFE